MNSNKFLTLLIIAIFQICFSANATEIKELTNNDFKTFSDEEMNFGLQDKNGNIIFEPKYKKLIRLGQKAWIVQKKNKYGIIDLNGNFLIEPKYRHADRVLGKYAKLGNDNDFGIYDENGKAILQPEYRKIDILYGQMFLTYKNYKYGITDFSGKQLLENKFDDIYMPNPKTMRIKQEGEWYEISRLSNTEIQLPEGTKKITIDNKDYKVTHLVANTGIWTGYSALTFSDYFIKIFSSISPAYEETIDELMFSHGTDTVAIFMKLSWIPKFPITYAKKYFHNIVTPQNGPLSDIRTDLKKQLK